MGFVLLALGAALAVAAPLYAGGAPPRSSSGDAVPLERTLWLFAIYRDSRTGSLAPALYPPLLMPLDRFDPPFSDGTPGLVLSDGLGRGSGRCNQAVWTYLLDEGRLRVTTVQFTRSLCPEGQDQEDAFLGALRAALEAPLPYSLSGHTLALHDSSGGRCGRRAGGCRARRSAGLGGGVPRVRGNAPGRLPQERSGLKTCQ